RWHEHIRPQHAAVAERGLKEFAKRLLKLRLAAGPHAAGDGDVNGHQRPRVLVSVFKLRGQIFLAVHGKSDLKTGFAGPGFKFDFPSVPVADDAVTDDQTQSGAGANAFRGEERLEQV